MWPWGRQLPSQEQLLFLVIDVTSRFPFSLLRITLPNNSTDQYTVTTLPSHFSPQAFLRICVSPIALNTSFRISATYWLCCGSQYSPGNLWAIIIITARWLQNKFPHMQCRDLSS